MKRATPAVHSRQILRFVSACLGALALFASPDTASAQSITIANPNWNITLTDYGYSDFLLDNTPGFGATGWILQESPDLSEGSWQDSTRTANVVGSEKQVTVSPLTGRRFFRLIHP